MQEYHSWIKVCADLKTREEIIKDVVSQRPRNWEWYEITVNRSEHTQDAKCGGDCGYSLLDFYSHGYPEGIEELTIRWPSIEFEVNVLDLSAPLCSFLRLKNGEILEKREDTDPFGELSDTRHPGAARPFQLL